MSSIPDVSGDAAPAVMERKSRDAATGTEAAAAATVADDAGLPATTLSRAALAGLVLCFLGLWLLQHPYGGLLQDSVLYAVAAFSRLHPDSLGHDIFLSSGTQDHYTIFSPIVAEAIRLLGVARAAALVTAISQAAFYCCAGLLARRLMPVKYTILAVTLVMLLPSLFGAQHVFWYTEDLMTPRVPASALVLGALACALGRRYVAAALCSLAALLIHPLMGLAGIVMLFMLFVGLRRPWLTVAIAVAGVAVLAVIAFWFPFGPVARFDSVWLKPLHDRLQYAFPSLWSLRDWGRMSVAASTLLVGAAARSPSLARSVCRAALATGFAGIAVAVVCSDLLHIVIVTQVQTWRWLWLANATAVLTLPVTAADCWRAGNGGRTLVLLVLASWIAFEQTFVPAITVLVVAMVVARTVSSHESGGRLMFVGSVAVLVLACLFFVGSVITDLMHEPAVPANMGFLSCAFWLVAHRVKPWTMGGIIPAVVFWSVWRMASRQGAPRAAMASVLLGATLCCALAPYAWFSWSDPAPSEALRARFAPWREHIPLRAQILAPGVPLMPWFLLERPSYWTLRQMAGLIFSRPNAMELLRRERVVHEFPPAPTAAGVLRGMCGSDRTIDFIMTPVDMGPSSFTPIALGEGRDQELMHLYPCADHRG